MSKKLFFVSLLIFSVFCLFMLYDVPTKSSLYSGKRMLEFTPCQNQCMKDYVVCGEKNCNKGDGFEISDCYHKCNRIYDLCFDSCKNKI